MSIQAEIEFTQSAFDDILRRERRRLSTGIAMRQHIHDQLQLGVVPDHYRMEWLRSCVLEIVDKLTDISKAFNEAHPNDKASSADYFDILHSTIRTLKNRVAGSGD